MADNFFASFVVTETMESQLRLMPDDMRLKYFDALLRFGLHGEEPEFSGMELVAWIPMRDMIAHAKRKDKAFREKQRTNGTKGGRPKNPPEPAITHGNPENPPEPKKPSENPESQEDNGNGNVNVNGNVNLNHNEAECDFPNDPQKLFVHIWQHTPDVFNALARIESPNEWNHFWATAPPSCDEVRAVMQNVIADVESGALERRFIAKSPDKFVLGGGFVRHIERYRPNSKSSSPPSLAGKLSLGDMLDD